MTTAIAQTVETNRRIANTILAQLGGNRFIAMTGARNLSAVANGLYFSVGRNSKGVNYCRINLTPADLYNVEYGFIRGGSTTVKGSSEGLYADQLQDDFTRATGLDTHL